MKKVKIEEQGLKDTLYEIFKRFDKDNDNHLNFNEFKAYYSQLRRKEITTKDIKEEFE